MKTSSFILTIMAIAGCMAGDAAAPFNPNEYPDVVDPGKGDAFASALSCGEEQDFVVSSHRVLDLPEGTEELEITEIDSYMIFYNHQDGTWSEWINQPTTIEAGPGTYSLYIPSGYVAGSASIEVHCGVDTRFASCERTGYCEAPPCASLENCPSFQCVEGTCVDMIRDFQNFEYSQGQTSCPPGVTCTSQTIRLSADRTLELSGLDAPVTISQADYDEAFPVLINFQLQHLLETQNPCGFDLINPHDFRETMAIETVAGVGMRNNVLNCDAAPIERAREVLEQLANKYGFQSLALVNTASPCPPGPGCGSVTSFDRDGNLVYISHGTPAVSPQVVSAEDREAALEVFADKDFLALIQGGSPSCTGPHGPRGGRGPISISYLELEFRGQSYRYNFCGLDDPLSIDAAARHLSTLANRYLFSEDEAE